MKVLTIVNNKGGVAKTSTVANISAYLAYMGYKVLMIDTDPQANLTQHFNFYDNKLSIADSYKEFKDTKGVDTKLPLLEVNPELFLVPSSPELESVQKEMVSYTGRERVLHKLIKPFQKLFDFCIIDCPPSLGLLTDNAVTACDGIILPIEASVFSLNGVKTIVAYLNGLREDLELNFELVGVFMSRFDKRNGISTAVEEEVRKYFKEKMFNTKIRTNIAISDAQANGEDIFMYSKNCNAALDYGSLSDEIIKRIEKPVEA